MFTKRVKFFIAVSCLFFLQYSFFPLVSCIHAKVYVPELLAAAIVFYACYVKKMRLLVFAFAVGLLEDIFAGTYWGVFAGSYVGAALGIYYVMKKISHDNLILRVFLTGLFTIFMESGVLITMGMEYGFSYIPYMFFYEAVPSIVYTLALAPVVLLLLRGLLRDSLQQYNLF